MDLENKLVNCLIKPTKWILINAETDEHLLFNETEDLINEVQKINQSQEEKSVQSPLSSPDASDEDDFDAAYDKWRNGDRSDTVVNILVQEGISEYQDGNFTNAALQCVITKVKENKPLLQEDKVMLQDLYAYLEDLNFHSGVEAIELLTGIEYI